MRLPGRFSTRSPSASTWRNARRYRNFGARGSMAQARVASYPRPSFAPRELGIDAYVKLQKNAYKKMPTQMYIQKDANTDASSSFAKSELRRVSSIQPLQQYVIAK